MNPRWKSSVLLALNEWINNWGTLIKWSIAKWFYSVPLCITKTSTKLSSVFYSVRTTLPLKRIDSTRQNKRKSGNRTWRFNQPSSLWKPHRLKLETNCLLLYRRRLIKIWLGLLGLQPVYERYDSPYNGWWKYYNVNTKQSKAKQSKERDEACSPCFTLCFPNDHKIMFWFYSLCTYLFTNVLISNFKSCKPRWICSLIYTKDKLNGLQS